MAALGLDMPCHPAMPCGALQGQRNDEGKHDGHSTQASAAGPAYVRILQCHCRERLHAACSPAGVLVWFRLWSVPSHCTADKHVACTCYLGHGTVLRAYLL